MLYNMNNNDLIHRFTKLSNINAQVLDESMLFFRNKLIDIDPKRGLYLNGPVDSIGDIIQTIRVGVISDSEGIEDVMNLFTHLNDNRVKNTGEQPFTTLSFPCYEKAYRARLIFDKRYSEEITSSELNRIIDIDNPNIRIKFAAEIYSKKVGILCDKVSGIDVIICHKPTEIEDTCGSFSYQERIKYELKGKERKKAEEIRKSVETHKILAPLDEDTKNFISMIIKEDFRRSLKAKAMKYEVPIQILNQSTLEHLNFSLNIPNIISRRHKKEDPSTVAWNISTALYCKANHSPWYVDNLRPGTCYIGIAFYYDLTTHEKNMFSSLAQIFSDTGEGVIVKGDVFHWETKKRGAPHLTNDAAQLLLTKAINLYKKHHNEQAPNRVVIHKTSTYTDDEKKGFLYASENVPKYDYLTISDRSDIFYYRNGSHPILRGTFLNMPGNRYLLYTAGYVPYLKSYYRPRVPKPIIFTEHHGDSIAEVLANEILALSRLDWNTTRYCSHMPITLKLARRVGRILGIVPKGIPIKERIWYYM